MERESNSAYLWSVGSHYESYVGRWSRPVAKEFLGWLGVPPGKRWLDIGCGTGALSQTILESVSPSEVLGIDRSEGYVEWARVRVTGAQARFQVGDALSLPVDSGTYDAAVSGLVLNFLPDPRRAVLEMKRAVRPGGQVAVYVWDYAGKMQMMRHFWNAAAALDPAATSLDEGRLFPICGPGPLADLFSSAGLDQIETRAIDVPTDFQDFDDYWFPFLSGQGPAPGYAMSLSEERRAALRERLRASLPFALDGSIPLWARAWAVRGIRS